MADEDSIKLKVEEDSSQVDRAKKKIELYRLELRDLKDAFDRGAVGGEFFRAEQARLEQQITRATKALEQSSKTAGSAIKGNMGYAMMSLSNAFDDAQYGIAGVVNNIPQLVTGLGFGMGVAGAAQVAAVAVNQLIKHMDDLDGLFGRTNINTFIEKLQKIAEVGDKATAAWQKQATGLGESGPLAGLRPAAESKAGAGIRSALAESGDAQAIGQAAVDRALVDKIANDPFIRGYNQQRDRINKEQAASREAYMAEHRRMFGSSSTEAGASKYAASQMRDRSAEINQINDAIEKRRTTLQEQARDETNRVIDAALAGDPAAAAVFANELRGQGKGELADKVQSMATDQAIQAGSDAEMADFGAMWDANEKTIKDQEKAQDKADKAREDQIKKQVELGQKDEAYAKDRAKDEKKYGEDSRAYELQMIEARLGMGAANMALVKNVFANPERVAASDFARKAESAGMKEPIELARQQVQLLKSIENYTKLAANPPKLGK